MDKSAEKSGKRLKGLDPLVLEIFNRYSWPGNIRELENVIEASTYFTSDETITDESLPAYIKGDNSYKFDEKSLKEILEETEKKVITQTLKKYDDRRSAAKALGISKSSLYEKIKKLGIE